MNCEAEEIDDLKEMLANHLKRIDTQALEEAISEKVSEMVGVKYDCRIDSIKYNNSGIQPAAQIELEIKKNTDDLLSGFGKS